MTTFFGSFDKEGNIIQITEDNKNDFSWRNGPHPRIKAVGVGEWGQATLKNVISTRLRGVDYLFCGPNTRSIRAKFNGLISEEKKADNTTPPDTGYAGVYFRHKGAPEWPPEELNIGVVEEEEKSLISAFAVADIVFIVADAKVCLDSLLMVARAAKKANTIVVGIIPRNIAFKSLTYLFSLFWTRRNSFSITHILFSTGISNFLFSVFRRCYSFIPR